VKTRAISSQAVQEWAEGSTTRPWSPERTVKAHERAAKRIYTPEQMARKKAYKAERKEHYAELNRKYREEHSEELREYLKNWKLNNPDRVMKYRTREKAKPVVRVQDYSKLIRARAERRKIDPVYLAKHNAARAARRAAVYRATPSWADRTAMVRFYVEAKEKSVETGIKYHVDHEIPLNHGLVCGLHVPANLRVIAGSLNMSKQNKFLLDEIV
jgi:hypothetical protein